MSRHKPTVLFLCADNSVRGPLAEALLRHYAGDRFECHSAGLVPKPVHPLVKDALREVGVSPGALASKRIGSYLGKHAVHWAIILRTAGETDAPRIFPFATRTWCWDVADPACDGRAPGEALDAIRRTRDELRTRMFDWLAEVGAPPAQVSAA